MDKCFYILLIVINFNGWFFYGKVYGKVLILWMIKMLIYVEEFFVFLFVNYI